MLFENFARWTIRLRWMVLVVAFGSVSIAPAGAKANPCLEWAVERDGVALTVQRAKGETLWQGETLAEITYWDATGAERPQPLTAGKGWTIESQSLATGCALTCRHAKLGFALRIVFAVSGDVLTVSVPAGAISETGNARLKTLRLLPRFRRGATKATRDTWSSPSSRAPCAGFATNAGRAVGEGLSEHLPTARCRCSAWFAAAAAWPAS